MSLLDNDIELFDGTDVLNGFPNKEDCIYETYYADYPTVNDTDYSAQIKYETIPVCEKFRYRCTNTLIKEKVYMPHGFDIIAAVNKSYCNYSNKFDAFYIQIVSIDYHLLKNNGMNLFLGTLPYKYKDKIQDVLYELIQKIMTNIFDFLEITDKYHYSSLYDRENNEIIRNFFGINENSLIF